MTVHWLYLKCVFTKLGFGRGETKLHLYIMTKNGTDAPVIFPRVPNVHVDSVRKNLIVAGIQWNQYVKLLTACKNEVVIR